MNSNSDPPTSAFRCHYEVLGIDRNADAATIKKAHRKLALQYHPDKNIGKNNANEDDASHLFLAVQQAYECLSDAAERKWYDEHRDALLRGWTAQGDNDHVDILFDLVPYMYAGCYNGYDDDDAELGTTTSKSFYAVYNHVFQEILKGETSGGGDDRSMLDYLSTVSFGNAQSSWDDVAAFYLAWESFSSTLSFAWADAWDLQQAEHRQVRRAMEDENKKARRQARRTRNEDVLALVQFVKRRDPRVKERWRKAAEEKEQKQQKLQQQAARKKKEKKKAMEQWREDAERQMAAAEEEDRKAGRIRLADLPDDYDYGGGKKKKGKKKKNKSRQTVEISDEEEGEDSEKEKDNADRGDAETGEDVKTEPPLEPDDNRGNSEPTVLNETRPTQYDEEESDSEEEEPGSWRCECCRKDFKSEGQMENHLNSKKHKVAWKKYEAKIGNQVKQESLDDQMDALDVND